MFYEREEEVLWAISIIQTVLNSFDIFYAMAYQLLSSCQIVFRGSLNKNLTNRIIGENYGRKGKGLICYFFFIDGLLVGIDKWLNLFKSLILL